MVLQWPQPEEINGGRGRTAITEDGYRKYPYSDTTGCTRANSAIRTSGSDSATGTRYARQYRLEVRGAMAEESAQLPAAGLFPLDATEPFPEYNVPPPTPPEQRKRQLRNDLAIEPEPYLPSLRIHRYRRP